MNKSFREFKDKNNLEVFYRSELNDRGKINEKMEEDKMALAKIQNEKINLGLIDKGILEVGIDAGNGNLKYCYAIKKGDKIIVKTGYLESNISLETSDEDGVLTYVNGVGYDFNTTEKVINKVVRGKDTNEHKGLLYKALITIHKETKDLSEDGVGFTRFNIVCGCSIDSWNIDNGKTVKDKMLEATTLDIVDENDSFTLKIEGLVIQPECGVGIYGFAKNTLTLLKEQDFLLIDIGNLNVGYVKYQKGFKRDKSLKVNCNGMATILTELCEYLNERDIKRRPISEKMLKDYLLDDKKYLDERFKDREVIIQSYVDSYISDFIQTATKSFKGDLSSSYKIVFIGGGAIALDRYLHKSVEKVLDVEDYNYSTIKIKEDVLFSNAKAFRQRAKKLFANEVKVGA